MPMTKKPDTQICDHCGGSGTQQHWYGPFFSGIDPDLQEELAHHLKARARILKKLDRVVASQLEELMEMKVAPQDLLPDLQLRLDQAVEHYLHEEGHESCLDEFFNTTATLLWILECEGYRPPETRERT